MKSFLEQLAEEVIRNGSPFIVHPGDHILIRLSSDVTETDIARLKDMLADRFPYNHVTLVSAEDIYVIRSPP